MSSAAGVATCRVRSVVLCFPNNPVGTTLTATEARDIAAFLDEKLAQFPASDFSVLLDEVYIGITAPGAHHSVLSYASARLLRNCFLVLSVSKGLGAMPGARGGFLAAFDQAVVPELVKVQMACTANASSVSQIGERCQTTKHENNTDHSAVLRGMRPALLWQRAHPPVLTTPLGHCCCCCCC